MSMLPPPLPASLAAGAKSPSKSPSKDSPKGDGPIKTEEPEKPVVHREPINIEQPFKTLNPVPRIIEPWEQYRASIQSFDEQVAEKMLELMLIVRAWAEARPTYEDIKGETEVRRRLDEIQKREEEQEVTRKKVMGFIEIVRSAIASLTNAAAAAGH